MKAGFLTPAVIPDLTRPNFGNHEDDVAISLKHLKLAEKEGKHKMRGTFPKPVGIPDLTRPNFGDKDEEVAVTQSNIELAEGKHEATLHAEFTHPISKQMDKIVKTGRYDVDHPDEQEAARGKEYHEPIEVSSISGLKKAKL